MANEFGELFRGIKNTPFLPQNHLNCSPSSPRGVKVELCDVKAHPDTPLSGEVTCRPHRAQGCFPWEGVYIAVSGVLDQTTQCLQNDEGGWETTRLYSSYGTADFIYPGGKYEDLLTTVVQRKCQGELNPPMLLCLSWFDWVLSSLGSSMLKK